MATIIIIGSLAFGLWGLYELVEATDRKWLRVVNGVACMGLFVAGFTGGRELSRGPDATPIVITPQPSTPRDGAPLNSTPLLAAQLNATLPPITFDSRWGAKREAEYMERYRAVFAEIGPPPTPDAVPKLGYMGRNGNRVSATWTTRPNSDPSDNFKATP